MRTHLETEDVVFICTRCDGKIFNLVLLKMKTKTCNELITQLLFANDTALVAHEKDKMQKTLGHTKNWAAD